MVASRRTSAAPVPGAGISMDDILAINPEFASVMQVDPSSFVIVVLQGHNPAYLNAAARAWLLKHNPGHRRPTPVDGVPGCKTCEAFTVIDLSASCTPGDRANAMAYMREVTKLKHVTRGCHTFLVYDMHLVNSRCFQNLRYARVLGTTCRPQSLSEALRSHATFLRLRTPVVTPPKLASLAQAAVAGDCIEASRKYSHEALKACLDPGMAYSALMTASGRPDEDVEIAAKLEHLSLQMTRPVHALELMALTASSDGNAAIVKQALA